MRHLGRTIAAGLIGLACLAGANPVLAASCGGDFSEWLDTFRREAAANGISQQTLAALDGQTPNPQVITLDRRQSSVFQQSFEQFGPPRVAQRLQKGQRVMAQYGRILDRVEQQFGVPAEIIVAIWGLETDFGVNMGKQSVLRALVTLAHDCRRSEMFQAELTDALRIIDRGDLKPDEMRGAWAGELGQTQFLPSVYYKFAVDFDGTGKRDLIHSVPDVLASTANYLKSYGWQRGGGWAEGSANFDVLKEWNRSKVYQQTIALFATRLSNGQ